jgi:molybdate/tungstate transport system substrate-binding protein
MVGEGAAGVRYRGEPIVYGLTIPRAARNPLAAAAFADFLLAEGGRSILTRTGFTPIEPVIRYGVGPAGPDPPP